MKGVLTRTVAFASLSVVLWAQHYYRTSRSPVFPSWAELILSTSRSSVVTRASQTYSSPAKLVSFTLTARVKLSLQGNFPVFSSFLKTITHYCSYRVVVCGGLLKWGRSPPSQFLSSKHLGFYNYTTSSWHISVPTMKNCCEISSLIVFKQVFSFYY